MRRVERVVACVAVMAGCFLCGAADEPDKESILAARVRVVMNEMLRRLPDYTCVETIERSSRRPTQNKFRMLDRVRVEVAYYKGNELFAWPGAPKFEERDLAQMVGGEGAIGTGDFALHLLTTYRGNAPLHFEGEETMRGRAAYKFTQKVPIETSNYRLWVPPKMGVVGYEVTAWHDAQSLDLLRFELVVTQFPEGVGIQKASKAIEYQDVTVGSTQFRLPSATELSMTHESGLEGLTKSTFSHCRQYLGESTITFGDPEPGEQPSTERASAKLPAGMRVQVTLNQGVELSAAARGDVLEMSVSKPVMQNGRTLLAKGTKIEARIGGVFCEMVPYANCFVLLKTEAYEDASRTGPFAGQLEEPDLETQLTQRNRSVVAQRRVGIPDEVAHAASDMGVLFVGLGTKLPRGYPMIWRTLEVSGGSTP